MISSFTPAHFCSFLKHLLSLRLLFIFVLNSLSILVAIITLNNRQRCPHCTWLIRAQFSIRQWERHVLFGFLELLFSLQMDRWDVFAGTKRTCCAFSLHFNGVFHPSISQPPASNIYPRRRALPSNGPPLSATHRFSVARIKDLSDIILSHVSPRRRFSKTRNLMFRLTSLDISLWISLAHVSPPTLSFERRPRGMITAHRLHKAGAGERAVLQVNRCCLFVYFVGKCLLELYS